MPLGCKHRPRTTLCPDEPGVAIGSCVVGPWPQHFLALPPEQHGHGWFHPTWHLGHGNVTGCADCAPAAWIRSLSRTLAIGRPGTRNPRKPLALTKCPFPDDNNIMKRSRYPFRREQRARWDIRSYRRNSCQKRLILARRIEKRTRTSRVILVRSLMRSVVVQRRCLPCLI